MNGASAGAPLIQRPAPDSNGIAIAPIPPTLAMRGDTRAEGGPEHRTKIWELDTNLHCSIIGTCLSTGELRRLLKKLGLAPSGNTDHELHGVAVALASRRDKAAKLLNKALDEHHRLAIRQFDKAATEDAVRELWTDAVRRGEVPGAYWATLTHPAATRAVIRDAFGEVHMLSHLVGAANRADIRRLCQLEMDNAALRARLDRQQAAFRDTVIARDACIRDLRQAPAQRIATEPPAPGDDSAILRHVVAELDRRLAAQKRRNAALEEKLAAAKAIIAGEQSARLEAEQACGALREELNVIESFMLAGGGDGLAITPELRLHSMTVLYVGGRQHQMAHLRAAVERAGATLLHHDGGIEHHLSLLPGLASRADIVVFPVACISHHAAQAAKLLCQQAGKRFIPLRSAGVACLLATLRRPEAAGSADAADRSDALGPVS